MKLRSFLQGVGARIDEATQVWHLPGSRDYFYSDGDATEEYLLSQLKGASDLSVGSPELSELIKDWPTRYHLSRRRSNLLRPFSAWLNGKAVLEIGSGCGAITRFLGETGASVLALEGSARRARITRSRCRDLHSVEVLCATANELPALPQFDAITLIGVLEYASKFDGPQGPAQLLALCRAHLKDTGRLILAIENRLGLKYFAGAPEDHLGLPMVGVNGGYKEREPSTFARHELRELVAAAGLTSICEYIPLPDYKLPLTIVTPTGWMNCAPDLAQLAAESVSSEPQPFRNTFFSMERVTEGAWLNSLAPHLANSFLWTASPSEDIADISDPRLVAMHFSDSRLPPYNKCTEFLLNDDRRGIVLRTLRLDPIEEEAKESALAWRAEVNTPFIAGRSLWHDLVAILNRPDWGVDEIAEWVIPWLASIPVLSSDTEAADRKSLVGGGYWDATPFNSIRTESGAIVHFDQEWTAKKDLPLEYLCFRAIFSSLGRVSSVCRPAPGVPTNLLQLTELVMRSVGFAVDREFLINCVRQDIAITSGVVTSNGGCSETMDIYERMCLNVRTLPSDISGPWKSLEQHQNDQEKALAELTQASDTLTRSVIRLESELLAREAALKEKAQALQEVANSTSWKITRPMRRLAALLRRRPSSQLDESND